MARASSISLASEMTPNEQAALVEIIRERALPGKHLEIGTAAGGTLCQMMLAARHQPRFVVVDTLKYFPNQRETVLNNLTAHGLPAERVEIREATSAEAYRQAYQAGDRFDFILVDGSHKFFYVMQDLRWARCLNRQGILALHDYSPKFPGVEQPVNYFLARNPGYRKLMLADSLLILEKAEDDPPTDVVTMPPILARLVHLKLQIQKSLQKRFGHSRPA